MKVYGDKMFTFEFSNEDDRKAVLDIGSFHVASQLFVVRPWKLFVEAETEELKTIPIWVLFKKLPIELWDRKGFSQVGSAIGRPLFADKPTEDRSRTSYARLCIEVDLKCKYPNHVDVVVDQKKVIRVAVEYNWRPTKCMECEVFGHNDAKCPKKQKVQAEKKAAIWLLKKEEEANLKEGEKVIEEKQTKVAIVEEKNEELGKKDISPTEKNEGAWQSPKSRHTCYHDTLEKGTQVVVVAGGNEGEKSTTLSLDTVRTNQDTRGKGQFAPKVTHGRGTTSQTSSGSSKLQVGASTHTLNSKKVTR
ncbi:Zinc knuckle (CCHC-type) family protein [Thalictrum thalictroides]|uniref:Zinc knuckle (CCHC-type) family protein n=1 Tax=Thalictrum thalictroides TaxID=46969 RepID=A0A7J6X386_THATH|nr:Zinc knuckle (CCHC-type) family protein [Thalictrum thalictroides]